jgi:hypothetical protein
MAMARNTMDIPISGILAKRSMRAMSVTSRCRRAVAAPDPNLKFS